MGARVFNPLQSVYMSGLKYKGYTLIQEPTGLQSVYMSGLKS